jgi:hypothetical protein
VAPTDQLDRIGKLIDALTPLGNKQRGMRIEADEWNRLVTTMLDILAIDKAQETTTRLLLEGSFAAKDHQHLGQVETLWLDPALQERISEGGGSLSVRTRLADVAKRVDTGAAEIARLTTMAAQQQQRNDRASVDELERSAKLRGFEDRFGAVEDLRGRVTGLDAKVTGLEPAIQAVLELRAELRDPAGAPIDVSALASEVEALQRQSQNFNGVDGKPVRMRDIEIRLKQIEDVLGLAGAGGLESRFAALADQLSQRLDGRVDERVGAARDQLAAGATAANQQLRAELDAKLADERTAAGTATDTKVAAAEARIGAAVADGLRTTGDSLRAELTTLVATRVADGIAGVPDQIDAAVSASEQRLTGVIDERADATRQELEALIANQVPEQVKSAVSAALEGLDQRIDGRISARLDDLLRTVDERVRSVVDERLADVPQRVADAVDRRLKEFDLPGRFKELGNRLREELRADNDAMRRQIADLDGRLRRLGG